jgi:hypothetical protein
MSPEPLLKWQSWPFMERPRTSVALVAFLVFLAWFLWHLTVVQWAMPFFYYLGMLLVLANLFPYFIPTTYELHEYEIEIRYLFLKITRRYNEFGCFYLDKRGVMLSTFKMPRRLDSFRGQSLRFSGGRDEKDALVEILARKIGKRY